MKNLLAFTALIECATGLLLIVIPEVVTGFLIGSWPGPNSAILILRIAGIALLIIGIVCWLSRNTEQNRFTRRLIISLMVYNITIPVVFIYMAIAINLSGPGLWPAVLIHLLMLAWCIINVIGKTDKNIKQSD